MKKVPLTLKTPYDVMSLIESVDRYRDAILSEKTVGVSVSDTRMIMVAQILHHIGNKLVLMHRNGQTGTLKIPTWEALALYELSQSELCNWNDTLMIQAQIKP